MDFKPSFGSRGHGESGRRAHYWVLLLSASLFFVIPGIAVAQTYNFVFKWGTAGAGNGQFNAPMGVGVDSSNNVFVADSANNRIQKFNSAGTHVLTFGNTANPAANRLLAPGAVAVSSTNIVYVVDTDRHRVQRYDGTTGANTAASPRWGSQGALNSQFEFPSAIALDSLGSVYVADTDNHRIQKFTATGVYTTQWGASGSGNGQFRFPSGIAVDSFNNVYVSDRVNNRIQKFSSTGVYITQWGSAGAGDGQFNAPRHIAVDGSDNVYVVDSGNNRVQKFSSTGTFLTKWGSAGAADGQFATPRGIARNSAGRVFVGDTGNNRIQVFGPLSTAPSNPGATGITTTAITFTWQDNSSDETGFKVYSDPGAGPPTTLQTTTAANVTSLNRTGLAVNVEYSFQVSATNTNGDSARTANFTAWTLAATPLAPVVSNPGTMTLDVAIAGGDGNPASTTYSLLNTESGLYVQAGGALGAAPVYQTRAAWGTVTVTGLADQTTYNFTATARNGALVLTAASPAGTGTTLDGTPPNATSIVPSTTGPTNAVSVDFTVDFDEDVQNFNDAADVVITHSGTAHTGVSIVGGPLSYTVTVSGLSGDGSFTVAVSAASDVQDLAGNALLSSVTSASVTIDNTAPNATSVVPATTGPTNAVSVDFTVDFDEAVQNFNDAADLVITHSGTAHTGVSIVGGPQSFTVTVSGLSGDGSFTVAVSTASDVQDGVGNLLASSVVSAPVVLDNMSPAITIGDPDPDTTAVGPVTFTVTYTGADTVTLAIGDITLNSTDTAAGTVGLSGSGSVYTITISDIMGDGTLTVSIAAGTATDLAGNVAPAAGPSNVLTVDSFFGSGPPGVPLRGQLLLACLLAAMGVLALGRRKQGVG